MAIALEDGQKVWRKVEQWLSSHDEGTASPAAVEAFRGLRMWLVCQKGNPNLQFVPFSAAQTVVNLGYAPIGGAGRVFGWYAKNPGQSGGTDSYITLHNAATNATVPFIGGLIQDDNDEFSYVSPRGLVFGTDINISAATTYGGATESAATDAADGFLVIGAA